MKKLIIKIVVLLIAITLLVGAGVIPDPDPVMIISENSSEEGDKPQCDENYGDSNQ